MDLTEKEETEESTQQEELPFARDLQIFNMTITEWMVTLLPGNSDSAGVGLWYRYVLTVLLYSTFIFENEKL